MWREKDAAAAEAKRVEDEKAEAAERERKAYSKAEKANSAAEIVLLKSAAEVDNALEVAGEAGGKQELVLREQIDARLTRKEEFTYPFTVVKGLPKGAPSGVKEKVRHLKALVIMMIEHDNLQGRNLVSPPVPAAAEGPQIARAIPKLSPGLRAPQLDHLDADVSAKQSAMKLVDDPKLLQLEAKYKGKIFTDEDPEDEGRRGKKKRKATQRFVIHEISFSKEHERYVAMCVEIDESGEIPASSKSSMGHVKRENLVSYELNELLDEMLNQ